MKKRFISDNAPDKEELVSIWLDLETISEAEITSENGSYPIEGVLLPDRNQGWKAGSPGTQTIRLLLTSRNTSVEYSLVLWNLKSSGRRSMPYDGLKTMGKHLGKSFANNGILALKEAKQNWQTTQWHSWV